MAKLDISSQDSAICYQPVCDRSIDIPLYSCAVSAGFPSPADDHLEGELDLNKYIIENPAATFFARAAGDSMEPGGIFDGDLLIVDRSIKARHGRVVVAAVNGEMLVKRLHIGEKTLLMADNPAYLSIELTEFCEVIVWGVVTYVVHQMRKRR